MRVKELLLEALSRANHIEDGTPADARELTKARKHFQAAMTRYSDNSLITAFQKVSTMRGAEEQVVGSYNLKRGKVMHEASSVSGLPDPARLTAGKDFGHTSSDDAYMKVDIVEGAKVWTAAEGDSPEGQLAWLDCCDFIPDVVIPDMQRVVAAMRRPGPDIPWKEMDFVPLTSFFTDESDDIYCSVPDGDNKVRLYLKPVAVDQDIRLVYSTSMKFKDDDYVELPEVYKELLTLATTVGLLQEDADSDPAQLGNYTRMMESIENQIMANNVNTRRIVRKASGMSNTELYTGRFISRRLCR